MFIGQKQGGKVTKERNGSTITKQFDNIYKTSHSLIEKIAELEEQLKEINDETEVLQKKFTENLDQTFANLLFLIKIKNPALAQSIKDQKEGDNLHSDEDVQNFFLKIYNPWTLIATF